MKIAHVVAVAKNGVIGVAGGLPWRLPDDLKHFKAVTMGHPVVMGRKTFESIGKPLPGRLNIVVSRNDAFRPQGVHVKPDIEAALATAEAFGAPLGADWIMIVGGGEIYRQTLERTERLYLTEIDAEVSGDTVYPDFDRADFDETARDEIAARGETPAYAFVTLDRVRQ